MTDTIPHLTEDERQSLADGTLPPGDMPRAEAHRHACAACHDDVERLRALMRTIEKNPAPVAPPGDDMWPPIRSRIEATKIGHLTPSVALPGRSHRRWMSPSLGMAAAAVILVALALVSERRRVGPASITYTYDTGVDTGSMFTTVADSTREYQTEMRAMLNELELQRSMLRPEAAAAIDHDLRVVDSAIAEVEEALKHSPNDPGLRRLLASSYREKLSVLHRVGNAG